jgi:hypothetical protein
LILKFDGDDAIIIFNEYKEVVKDIDDLLKILHSQDSEALTLVSVIRFNNRLFFTYMKNPKESGDAELISWIFFERRFTKFSKENKLVAFETTWINHNRIEYSKYYKIFKEKDIEILIDNGNITYYIE